MDHWETKHVNVLAGGGFDRCFGQLNKRIHFDQWRFYQLGRYGIHHTINYFGQIVLGNPTV